MIENKKILFVGSVNVNHSADGYSNASRGMLSILSIMKKNKIIKSIDAIDINNIHNISLSMNYFDTIILIINPFFLNNPVYKEKLDRIFSRGKKVFLHMVWETDPMPSYWDWIWQYEKFTGFIAPSKFVMRLMMQKTNKPVFLIPHFVNTQEFTRIDIDKKKNENIFTVLSVGQWTKRKGNEDAIVAFSRALGHRNDCRLIVKYTELDDIKSNSIESQIKYFMKVNNPQVSSPVMVTEKNLTFAELNELYKMASDLLFPSRGEGFGLPPAEIMSVGIPVIYTGWSATPEICEAPGNIPIKYILDESVGMSPFGYEKGSRYAIPFLSDLILALEYKYNLWFENKEKYYKETINNFNIINNRFGVEILVKSFIYFLENNERDDDDFRKITKKIAFG
jgi:glycosyltransferase involved in cell wall biosynthesis